MFTLKLKTVPGRRLCLQWYWTAAVETLGSVAIGSLGIIGLGHQTASSWVSSGRVTILVYAPDKRLWVFDAPNQPDGQSVPSIIRYWIWFPFIFEEAITNAITTANFTVYRSVTSGWPLGFCCSVNFVEFTHRSVSFRGSTVVTVGTRGDPSAFEKF